MSANKAYFHAFNALTDILSNLQDLLFYIVLTQACLENIYLEDAEEDGEG